MPPQAVTSDIRTKYDTSLLFAFSVPVKNELSENSRSKSDTLHVHVKSDFVDVK